MSQRDPGARDRDPRPPEVFFAEQYREYLPRVLNYVRLRVPGEDLAQELTSQTFERALSRLHTLRDRGAFGGWLFRIARSIIAGYYRRRRPLVSLEDVGDLSIVDGSSEDSHAGNRRLRGRGSDVDDEHLPVT